ncbi:MAG: S9 family peptidase [Bacteroides sp.]|nr:S9 family peptidase [Bacteroides sp.]
MNIFKSLALSATVILSAVAGSAAGIADYPDMDRYLGAGRYAAAPKAFTYMPDGAFYMQLSPQADKVVKYDTRTAKEVETILDLSHTRETTLDHIQGFRMSPDGSKLLVWRNARSIYRRSFEAEYYVYELRTRILKPLSEERTRQQAPIFSPDGRMVAYVSANNIYLKKLDFGTEVAVTTDGEKNRIINGVPDWTYEEEFTTSMSMAWAPDNSTLCYLKYNESQVPLFTFPIYEGYCNPDPAYALYPGSFTYKYPVAGQPNSVVSIHSYDVDTRKTKDITLPDSKIEYIPRINYAFSADRLIVTTLNRAQNRMELYTVNPKSTVVSSLLVEQYDKAWLAEATYEDIHYYPDFFVVTSSRTGFNHLYQYSYSGALMQAITSGDYDVTAYYGYDAKRECHYYQSTSTGAINRMVSRIDRKGKITDLTPASGTASATFSPDMAFYTIRFTDTHTPAVYTLYTAEGNQVKVLEDNAALKARYADLPGREFFTMQSDGVTLNGYIVKAPGFDASVKHPVVMFQYSGPGSQQVLNQWSVGWMEWYASQGYVIVCVDGRGTGGRGRAFMDVVYKNLGHYESIDQVAAARYAASLPYVDASRIGIHGWSYGGYETLMAASMPDAPYAAAVSVAPVTDWRYYDTVYAERYMLTPQENEDGYRQSAPLNKVTEVKCPLLVMSGTADDNVHFSNTVEYVGRMEGAGRWCDVLFFPNMDHSINGCGAQKVVYARMLDYFNRNMR